MLHLGQGSFGLIQTSGKSSELLVILKGLFKHAPQKHILYKGSLVMFKVLASKIFREYIKHSDFGVQFNLAGVERRTRMNFE